MEARIQNATEVACRVFHLLDIKLIEKPINFVFVWRVNEALFKLLGDQVPFKLLSCESQCICI